MIVILAMVEGAVFAAGLALSSNLLLFQATNWGFIALIAAVGAVVGGIGGFLVRDSEPSEPLLLFLGPIIGALVTAIFVLAFNYFLAGGTILWRLVAALSMIATGPGMMLGWVLAQQASDQSRVRGQGQGVGGWGGRTEPAVQSRGGRRQRERESPGGRERRPGQRGRSREESRRPERRPIAPGPVGGAGPGEGGRLVDRLRAELQNLPRGYATKLDPVKDSDGSWCVTVRRRSSWGLLNIYLVCSPSYPEEPPQLLVSQSDRMSDREQELDYSFVLDRLVGDYSISAIVNAVVEAHER